MPLGLALVHICHLKMVFRHLPVHVCHVQPMHTPNTPHVHTGASFSYGHASSMVMVTCSHEVQPPGARSGMRKSYDNDARILGKPGWTMGFSGP